MVKGKVEREIMRRLREGGRKVRVRGGTEIVRRGKEGGR